MDVTDELKIISNCQAGRREEFGLLYDSYIKKIYGFIYYKVQEKETAEDICSETFIKAFDKLGSFNPKRGKFSSWIYQIARNAVIDYFRSKKFHFSVEDMWDLRDKTDIEKNADTNMRLDMVQVYMERLNPREREIITMKLWQDMPYKEIAEITGKSQASCKMSFLRAISRLKASLPMLLVLVFLVMNSVAN